MSDDTTSGPPATSQRWIITGVVAIAVLAVLMVGGVIALAAFRPSAQQAAAGPVTPSATSPRPTRTPILTKTPGPPTDTPTGTATATETPRGTFTPLPTHTIPPPTSTPRPTSTRSPIVATFTPQPTTGPTVTPTVDYGGCNYDSSFVEDTTIPSGTDIEKGTDFTKTWRIQNTGCQGWQADNTRLAFVSGDQMGAPDSVGVDHTKPGQKQYVSVDFTAPSAVGSYTSRWQMVAPDGNFFGQIFIVNIQVIPVQVTFNATYAGTWQCSGKPKRYFYAVEIDNTSTLTFQSASWKLTQKGNTVNSGSDNTPFQSVLSASNCSASSLSISSLGAGDSAWVSAFVDKNPLQSGKKAGISLTLCTKDSGNGTCSTANVTFTP